MNMKETRLESFKYPRRPRYFMPVSVIEDSARHLLLYTPPGSPVYVGKEDRIVSATAHTLSILWPERYYNAMLFWRADWTFRGYYVNLALPHEWDGELCAYVDLELDVARFEDGPVQILDEDEYEESKIQYNYPEDLVARIAQATTEVVELLERRVYPFDGSLENWRPEAA